MAKNSLKMGKKALCLIFAFLLSIESFGAIVGDSDGGAFVTKQEFEELKSDFNKQIDNYNDSIDNKINGYIASYIAGIQVAEKKKLENKYALINPTWMKNKRFNKSQKGTKYTIFMSFTEGTYNTGGTGWMSYCFEGTATSWYRNKSLVKNEDDPEYLYRIQKKKIGKFENEWSLQDLIQSDYSMTIGGGAAGGRGGDMAVRNVLAFPDYTLFTKGTQKYWGTWYSTLPVSLWNVNTTSETLVSSRGHITGSGGGGESLAITAIAKDIPLTDDSILCLAGGSLTNDTMYCVNIASASEIGDKYKKAKTNAGGSRQYYLDGGNWDQYINWANGYYDDVEVDEPYYGNIEAEIYRHVITELNATDLLNETITQNIGEKTYYYSGCPLFSVDDNGTVDFKIKFKNTEGAQTKWALSSSAFKNEANPGNCGDIDGCSEKDFLADDDETITVKFMVKKDTTYWIKAEPQSGYTTIEFVGDINMVGE